MTEDRYAAVVSDLSALYEEKSFHERECLRIQTETVYAGIEAGDSVASAERRAKFYSLEHALAIIELEAKIQALLLEKEYLCR